MQVVVVFFEELMSDVYPWRELIGYLGICANASDIKAAQQANSLSKLWSSILSFEWCMHTWPMPRSAHGPPLVSRRSNALAPQSSKLVKPDGVAPALPMNGALDLKAWVFH